MVAMCAHLPTALKESDMLIVTSDAVPLTVCGSGISGDLVQDAGYRLKDERWALCEIVVVEEQRVRAHKARREAVIPECKFVLLTDSG